MLTVQTCLLTGFSALYLSQGNVEFLYYVLIILGLTFLILYTLPKTRYPNEVLWGLVLWTGLHLAGGSIRVGDGVLYSWIPLPLSETLPIIRFDQLVHLIGFGVATLLMYHLLYPPTGPRPKNPATLLVVVMAGLGVGALNEIVEFVATLITPHTGVGGYLNTALDLVADLIGAILAVVWIRLRK